MSDGIRRGKLRVPGWGHDPLVIAGKLLKENAEVASNMNKLEEFMKTEEYGCLPIAEQRLMIIQDNIMNAYADILLQRIDEIKKRI